MSIYARGKAFKMYRKSKNLTEKLTARLTEETIFISFAQ